MNRKRLAVVCLLFWAFSCGFAHAETGVSIGNGLGWLDWAVVVAYAAGMLAVGFYYSRHTSTSEDYYLGSRRMRPAMVGLSLFATLISTISYLANPGEAIKHGPIVPIMYICSLPLIFLIVGFVLIPYIAALPVTSAYQILEGRLGREVRLFGSCLFLLLRFAWMGLVVSTASKIIVTAIGWNPAMTTPFVILALGTITVVYSSLGGLRAVVLTDAIQSLILFVGALGCIVIVTVKMGGFGWFPTQWMPNWDVQPVFSFDPGVRVTMFGSVLNVIVWWICTAGSDQMAIQRYLATRDAKAARRAFLVSSTADTCVTVTLLLVGFALLGFFSAHPEYLSEGRNLTDGADYLFPYFLVNFMDYGTAGLLLAGMMAAAMSSLSSGVNSVATVFNTDVVTYFLGQDLDDARKVRLGKWVSLVVGAIVIVLAFLMAKVPGNIMEVTQKTNGLFVPPLFGLFFIAMFSPYATPMGAVFGSLYGLVAGFLTAFWDLTGTPGISFQWILVVALIVNIVVGCGLSWAMEGPLARADKRVLAIFLALPLAGSMAWFVWACAV